MLISKRGIPLASRSAPKVFPTKLFFATKKFKSIKNQFLPSFNTRVMHLSRTSAYFFYSYKGRWYFFRG